MSQNPILHVNKNVRSEILHTPWKKEDFKEQQTTLHDCFVKDTLEDIFFTFLEHMSSSTVFFMP